jgi:hypothetical protein
MASSGNMSATIGQAVSGHESGKKVVALPEHPPCVQVWIDPFVMGPWDVWKALYDLTFVSPHKPDQNQAVERPYRQG